MKSPQQISRPTISSLLLLVVFASSGLLSCQQPKKPEPETIEVQMVQKGFAFAFDPEEITVNPGDTVRWVLETEKEDPPEHQVRFEKVPEQAESLLNSKKKNISPVFTGDGQSWEITFSDEFPPGTYQFTCTKKGDAGMEGQIRLKSTNKNSAK